MTTVVDYYKDIAANRAVFSDISFEIHYERFMDQCDHSELVHGIEIFPGNRFYPEMNGTIPF